MTVDELSLFDINDERLYYEGRYVLDILNEFFDKLPLEYRENYDINLASVILYKDNYGKYYPSCNTLIFNKSLVLIHEMMHMASYDSKLDIDGYFDEYENGIGLTEGMTEYLTMKATGKEMPTSYYLQVFSVEMLLKTFQIMDYYFKPDYQKFVSLFPDRILIDNLIFNLDYYTYGEMNEKVNIDTMILVVKKILKTLVNIQLSVNNDRDEFKLYKRYFMELYKRYSRRYLIFSKTDVKNYVDDLFIDKKNDKIKKYVRYI